MLILVADSHVIAETPAVKEFENMLRRISNSSYDVCFLGDILELWLSLNRFEGKLAKDFLDWCRKESKRRNVYLVEGNHEFYVYRHHQMCFTRCEPNVLKLGKLVMAHGDLSSPLWTSHRLFRFLSKSRLTQLALAVLPGMDRLVAKVKRLMEKRALNRKIVFPYARMQEWSADVLEQYKADCLIIGHFHVSKHGKLEDGRSWHVIPDWKKSKKVGLCQEDGKGLRLINWRQI